MNFTGDRSERWMEVSWKDLEPGDTISYIGAEGGFQSRHVDSIHDGHILTRELRTSSGAYSLAKAEEVTFRRFRRAERRIVAEGKKRFRPRSTAGEPAPETVAPPKRRKRFKPRTQRHA